MLNLKETLELTDEQKNIIQSLEPLTKECWDKHETKLRKAIRSSLISLQNNFCVYCGCPVHGLEDVEHIAHKATYPQFLFTPKNLVYSCKMCNQTYKGRTDIVVHVDSDYEKCSFSIVHPYLDDVDHFFDTTKIAIQIRQGLNPQEQRRAKNTYKLLHWNDSAVLSRRAEAAMAQKYTEITGTSITQVLYENTLTYKPGIL